MFEQFNRVKKQMRIKDIADASGVSTATVSHVINNTRFVTDETRARVEEVISRFNYYPNAQARSLASGRSTTLGLVVSDLANPFFPELVKAIEATAYEHGYDVLLANTSYDAARTLNYVHRFIERRLAGVVLMTSELDARLIDELACKAVPVVFLDLGSAGAHMSNIIVDYERGIEDAIKHLHQLGHQRIAFIGGPHKLRSAQKRLQAFHDSLARHLPHVAPHIYEGDFQFAGGEKAANQMLATNPKPTAVVVANDMMALGVMRACHIAGVRVPEDLSIIGYDDIAFAAFTEPGLTTVCLPRAELGRQAVTALMATINHPERQGVEMHVSTYLVERGSTAPPQNQQPEKPSPTRNKSSRAKTGGKKIAATR